MDTPQTEAKRWMTVTTVDGDVVKVYDDAFYNSFNTLLYDCMQTGEPFTEQQYQQIIAIVALVVANSSASDGVVKFLREKLNDAKRQVDLYEKENSSLKIELQQAEAYNFAYQNVPRWVVNLFN